MTQQKMRLVPEREFRKTATIRATQWFKMGDHPAVTQRDDPPDYWLPTLEGGHVVTPGDWIATGVQGEHWPIKPDVFAATYAEVQAAQPPADGESREVVARIIDDEPFRSLEDWRERGKEVCRDLGYEWSESHEALAPATTKLSSRRQIGKSLWRSPTPLRKGESLERHACLRWNPVVSSLHGKQAVGWR